MMRFVKSCPYLVALCCLLSPLLCAAQSSKTTWISFEVPGAYETIPSGVNDSTFVTGTYVNDDDSIVAGFVRNPIGYITTFSIDNSEYTAPVFIDYAGEIYGQYFDGHITVGFVRKPDGTVDTFSPRKDDMTYVTGGNARGDVTGYFTGLRATSPVYAYIRRHDGLLIRFHVPGSLQTFPQGIGGGGDVVGYYKSDTGEYRGFVRTYVDRAIHTFAVPGYSQTMPTCINSQGTTVGKISSTDANYGFLRSIYGTMANNIFGVPGGTILPQSINTSAVITGYFYAAASSGSYQAFMGKIGALTFFDFPGGTDTDAISINNFGVITGDYSNGFGIQGFLRIPD